MQDRFHPPVEEYLETIFALEEEGIPVIQARVAERLGYRRYWFAEHHAAKKLNADSP